MAPTEITIVVDENLSRTSDQRLMLLWHLSQANPADSMGKEPGELAMRVGWEIIRRWIRTIEPEMYHHQQRNHYWHNLTRFAKWDGEKWVGKADVEALPPCPVPASWNGKTRKCEHGEWPCPLTVVAWQIRGLDPDAERKSLLAAAQAASGATAERDESRAEHAAPQIKHWAAPGLRSTTLCQGEPLAPEAFTVRTADLTCPACRTLRTSPDGGA